MLVKVLKEPKNAILKQYQKLLELDEVKLEFDEDAITCIAQKAVEKKTGARGLRSIIEQMLLNIMFDVPSIVRNMKKARVVITEENEAEKIMDTLKEYCNCHIIGRVTDDEKITVKAFEGSEIEY